LFIRAGQKQFIICKREPFRNGILCAADGCVSNCRTAKRLRFLLWHGGQLGAWPVSGTIKISQRSGERMVRVRKTTKIAHVIGKTAKLLAILKQRSINAISLRIESRFNAKLARAQPFRHSHANQNQHQ